MKNSPAKEHASDLMHVQVNLSKREAHYQKFIGALAQPVMHSTDVKDVHIDIYQFAPTKKRPYWTLITGGMSDKRQALPEGTPEYVAARTELVLYAQEPKPWMFSVLKGMAEMPLDGDSFLSWHHTVPNGMPMTEQTSLLTSYFFLPPFFEKKNFESLEIEGDQVGFLLMIPITENERLFAIENGSSVLEDLMAKKGFDPVVDEARSSLV